MDGLVDLEAAIQTGESSIFFTVTNEKTLWRVNSFWEKEPETIRWIDTFKPDELFFDIGANIGLYSLYAACTRGVNVFAFEPEALNYALLNKNIFLNKVDHKIKAFSLAISDENSLDALHLSQFQEGGSCHNFGEVLDFRHESFQPHFSQGCFSTSLDELIQNYSVPIPQHIKIDVDGIEHKVINGALRTLANPKLRSVLVEINTHLPAHRQIIDLMKENDFFYTKEQADANMRKEGRFQGVGNFIFYRK